MDPTRKASASLALCAALLGIGSKFYAGPAADWVRHYAGGALYEIVWIGFFSTLLPRTHPWHIALAVLAGTALLETLQLWHPPFLQAIRATFVGHALLGNTFSWWDFPHYIIGSSLGLALLLFTNKVVQGNTSQAERRVGGLP